MSGCEGCFQSIRGQQEELNIISAKAREYAQEIQEPVAVYKEGYEYKYTRASFAIEQHYLIVQVVSFHS
jgi:hypothetical protein